VQQLKAFLDAVPRKEMMKSGARETMQEAIEMIRAGAAVLRCVCKPEVRVRVRIIDENPKPLEPAGVDTPPSNFRERRRRGEKRTRRQKVRGGAFLFHEVQPFARKQLRSPSHTKSPCYACALMVNRAVGVYSLEQRLCRGAAV